MDWVPISYFPVKLLNMLTLSSKVHQIIKCLESDFPCNCDVSMLCVLCENTFQTTVLIMDQQARVMYVAARPFSSFLKWHMKIILI